MRDFRFMRDPDVFRIELGGSLGTVAYAPWLGCAALCHDGRLPPRFEKEMEAWRIGHGKTQDGMSLWPARSLTVLPTWTCNFHCSYCYAAAGRRHGGGEVKTIQILGALKRLISEYKSKRLGLFFAGGGEPLLAWSVLRDSINGSQRIADESGVDLRLGLVTNASLVTSKKARFLLHHNVHVTASWDILPDVQEKQRGEPRQVLRGIETLIDSGVNVSVRATVTSGNENRQVEMVRQLARLKLGTLSAVFEPALPFECGASDFQRVVKAFLVGFKAAHQVAVAENLKLETSLLGRLVCSDSRFCAPGWTLTPDGMLTLCHRVAHRLDSMFDRFVFGHVENNGDVVFDEARRRQFVAEDSACNPRCRNCFARWNCGGGCRMRNLFLSEPNRRFLCRLMRRELRTLIAERLTASGRCGQ